MLRLKNAIDICVAQIKECDRHLRNVYFEHGKESPYPNPLSPERKEALENQMAYLKEQLAYWQELFDQKPESKYSPDTIKKGDLVFFCNEWREVVKVNKKTVTVTWFCGKYLAPYHALKGHKSLCPVQESLT